MVKMNDALAPAQLKCDYIGFHVCREFEDVVNCIFCIDENKMRGKNSNGNSNKTLMRITNEMTVTIYTQLNIESRRQNKNTHTASTSASATVIA